MGQGISARKKLHELREECGAVIANSLGIFAVKEDDSSDPITLSGLHGLAFAY